jgi:murein DD-endopeptidase MepM/ murein hydrolase activator NlpD
MVDNNNNGMTPKSPLANGAAKTSCRWVQALMLCGGVGLASGGFAVAETTNPVDMEDTIQTSAEHLLPVDSGAHQASPAARSIPIQPTAPAPSPQFASPKPSPPVAQTSPSPAVSQMQTPAPPPPTPTVVIPAPERAPTMAESLLQPSATPSAPEVAGSSTPVPGGEAGGSGTAAEAAPATVVPSEVAADESVPAGFNSVFIDPTNYNVGATQAPAAPDIVFSERSTGCQMTVSAGQGVSGSTCGAPTPTPQGETVASVSGSVSHGGGVQVGPVSIGPRGVSLGSTTVVSREFLNEKLRPLNILRRGDEQYVFPLSIPASITSVFGWRMHPIHQSWRFHSGTDLAAPLGTPVLATQAGRVAVSDYLGGYGLTVILRHGEDLESRYAHLSQITVSPGEWVEQGEVVGLVGSTGTSTGPHLHFEVRQLTAQGWVAVDAQDVLEYGLAGLMEILDNPLQALRPAGDASAENGDANALPVDYPFRPAQPNAS